MSRSTPLRDATPTGGTRGQKDASISSMERALRTLTPPSFPVPQTPRPNNGNGQNRAKKQSFKSMAARESERTSDGSEEAVKVAIRMRPLAPSGEECVGRAWRASSELNSIVEIPSGRSVQNPSTHRRRRDSGESEYIYDKVFGEDTNTCEIYNEVVGDIVESVTKEGVNGTIFTYGQTSSGKTFTMQGCDSPDSSIGIIHLAAKDIFQSIREDKNDGANSECSVRVSYVEIYNEELRDLLNENSRRSSTSLIIREDKRGSISVEGLKEVAVNSLEQLMDVFRVGETNKSVGSTKMNDRSSRSHAILKIIVERKTALNPRDATDDKENAEGSNNASESAVKTSSALNLVDLAGSESVRHTGASGMQKKEGGTINQSLLTLSKVLMSLGQKNPGHINYRDSKLTRILKPSLSGNARMAVICCISPSGKYVEETRSTLQFATRAKLVKTNAVANEVVEDTDLIAKLRLDNAKAKWENRKLEDRLRKMEQVNSDALATKRELDNLKKFVFSERSKTVSQSGVSGGLSVDSEFFTDEHCNLMSIKEAAFLPSDSAANNPTSKDDLHILPTRDKTKDEALNSSNGIFRAALQFKSKQVEKLLACLEGSTSGKDSKAVKKKRYSLISDARSPDVDRRYSMINELRSPDVDRRVSMINQERTPDDDRRISMINGTRSPDADKAANKLKPAFHDTDYYQTENLQLVWRLANANLLITGLQRQIDDLASHKNDALDWIEELFAHDLHIGTFLLCVMISIASLGVWHLVFIL